MASASAPWTSYDMLSCRAVHACIHRYATHTCIYIYA
jgi:hypothetical protein